MARYKSGFNDKARAGMIAKQLELKRARQKRFNRTEEDSGDEEQEAVQVAPIDPNAEILLPMTTEEKLERKRKLEESIKAPEKKMSNRKRKRVEKYIEKQLKKEEKKEVLAKLEESKIDTTLLKSFKSLGNRNETKRDAVEHALVMEKLGQGTEESRALLYEERQVKDWTDSDLFKPAPVPSTAPVKEPVSGFIDHRPQGGSTGFGFQNLTKVTKTKKTSYKWRAKVQDQDSDSDSESETESDDSGTDSSEGSQDDVSNSDSSNESDEDSSSEDSDGEFEEFHGFSDSGRAKSSTGIDGEVEEEEGVEDEGEEEEEDEEEEQDEDEEEEEDEDDDEEEEDEDMSDPDESESRKLIRQTLRTIRSKGEDYSIGKASKGDEFKEWAKKLSGTDKVEPIVHPEYKGTYVPVARPEDQETLPAEYVVKNNDHDDKASKAFYVHVERDAEIQATRLKLPVVGEEQRIMEAINSHDCVVLCGETGSGKTTQVPQFLFEAGYGNPESDTPGMIGVTQPRRVAAVSMADRVGKELGNHGDKVAYQVRFDATVNKTTALKFMTDGVLLRELSSDLALRKYSVVIIDEAHERNVNTDILIGVLSRVLKLRKEMSAEPGSNVSPLKLIIMSATLRVSDFTENKALFSVPPPVLKIEARQFPVSVHFNRRTAFNYAEEAFRKASKIHRRLPPGGILIFMTSQNEITQLVRRLRKTFPSRTRSKDEHDEIKLKVDTDPGMEEVEDLDLGDMDAAEIEDNFEEDNDQEEEEEEEGFEEAVEETAKVGPLHVLPLYSLLPTQQQLKVFEEPPAGSRLCVVATNVAETSLTIPGIRYVVDCGRAKERCYDDETGVQSFKVSWTSKASSGQRAGRAGRTGPGHCYRLFSSAVYETDFDQFSVPEIMRMPIEGLVLQMKAMGIHHITNFPFPTPPPRKSIEQGLKLLKYLGAIETGTEQLTDLGRTMNTFPLAPRFAKMLAIGNQFGCLPYIIAIVSGLSVGDPFVSQNELGIEQTQASEDTDNAKQLSIAEKEAKSKLRREYHQIQGAFSALDSKSDAFRLLSAICAYEFEKSKHDFCERAFLRSKLMREISKLRRQISGMLISTALPDQVSQIEQEANKKLVPPTAQQLKALKQMIASGFVDQIAIRGDVLADIGSKSRLSVISYPYLTVFPTKVSGRKPQEGEQDTNFSYIHPNSVLVSAGETPPEYIVYASANLSESHKEGVAPKVRLKPLCDITPSQLSNVAKSSTLITYSKPLGPPYGPKLISSTKREAWVVPRFGAAIGTGQIGWDLPAKKVIQEKQGTQWVVQ